MGFEEGFVLRRVAAEHQHVVYPQEIEVDQCIFRFFLAKPAADKVRHGIDLVVVHDGRANTHGTGALADLHFVERAVCTFS